MTLATGRLTAQFIQGVDVCETSISEGLYSQAAALLKQQLETVTAIDEFEQGKRREGKTPNVGNSEFRAFGPIYGDLNDIAHVARNGIAKQLVEASFGELHGPSTVPVYNAQLAKFLYGNHIYFIVEVAKQIDRLFREIFGDYSGMTDAEKDWFMAVMGILIREKVIQPPPKLQHVPAWRATCHAVHVRAKLGGQRRFGLYKRAI